jgi:hypothetical protein
MMIDPADRGPMCLFVALIVTFGIVLGFVVFGVTAALSQERGIADDDREGVARAAVTRYAPRARRSHSARAGRADRNSVSLAGVTPPLANKAREIQAACGSKVVSAIRRGARVYGGSRSNHASGRAVDLQGNPSCIYSHVRDWPGGVSTDYGSAPGGPHVHLSYNPNGMEWGLRFRHRHARRAAR